MLSDQDREDILADAHDPKRRRSFADSRRRAIAPMTWAEYFIFLRTTQNLFGLTSKPHKIIGENFKL